MMAVAMANKSCVEATTGSINNQGGLTNGGEVVVLYYWNGQSDLVTDLDYAVWGDKDEAVDKTGVAIDGPDADSDTSAYLNDTAIASQDVIDTGAHSGGNSWQRDDLTEGTEVKTGGNGAEGHDETSENLSTTWCEFTPTPGAENLCQPITPPLSCTRATHWGDCCLHLRNTGQWGDNPVTGFGNMGGSGRRW